MTEGVNEAIGEAKTDAERDTCEKKFDMLLRRYGDGPPSSAARLQFDMRRQNQGEKIDTYLDDLAGLRNRGHLDETVKVCNWEISKKFMTGLQDENLQHSLLTLYTGEQFAKDPPTVVELRANCRDFLTMMSVNQRQPNVKDQVQTQQSTSNQMASQQKAAQQATAEVPQQSPETPPEMESVTNPRRTKIEHCQQ